MDALERLLSHYTSSEGTETLQDHLKHLVMFLKGPWKYVDQRKKVTFKSEPLGPPRNFVQ